jgi:signal transduction histidine kinase
MRSFRLALIGLGIAAIVFGLIDILVLATSDHVDNPLIIAILSLDVAWSFIFTGLFTWWRRPENRVGAMMTAVGFAFLLIPLVAANNQAVFMVGFLGNNLAIVMLAHLLMAFPNGSLDERASRWLTGTAYFVGVGVQIPLALVLRDTTQGDICEGCPSNPLAVIDDFDLFKTIQQFQSVLGALVVVGVAVMLWQRWRRFGPSQRASMTPVLMVGGVTLLVLGIQLILSAIGTSQVALRPVYYASIFTFALVPYAFLFGMVRSRFSRAGAVSELIAALNYGPSQALDVRAAVAEALGDDSLQLAFWLPDRGKHVDSVGRVIDLPQAGSGRSSLPVERDGELIATIVYDSDLDEHRDLVKATGDAAALALQNERLEAELRARVDELRSSRARLVEASDSARRQLERDLHDGAQQHLVSLALQLRMARTKIESDPAAAAELLDEAAAELAEATDELRELARGIHPAVLTDRGLEAALKALAGRAPLPVEVVHTPDQRLPEPIESAAYFVVAEALTNVAKYANATHAEVDVTRQNGLAAVEVRDDGVGGANPDAGTGLRGLADRVAALDGRLEVVSPRGQGTIVRAQLPCV